MASWALSPGAKKCPGPKYLVIPLEAQRSRRMQSKPENTKEEGMVPQESSRKISEQAGRVTQKRESPEWHARHLSRRSFIRQAGLTAAAMALLPVPSAQRPGLIQPARPPSPTWCTTPITDCSLSSFPATYSGTPKNRGERRLVRASQSPDCQHGSSSAIPANFSVELAAFSTAWQRVNHSASGRFLAPFANLSFPEKVKVFELLEGGVIGPEPALPSPCPAPVRRFLGLLGGRGLRPEYAHADRPPGLDLSTTKGSRTAATNSRVLLDRAQSP